MNRIKTFLLILFSVAAVSSCEDNRKQFLADDTVYLVKNGIQEVTVSRTEPTVVSVWTTKAGYSDQSARIVYTVDQTALDGTGYRLLPEECYSVPQWDFDVTEIGGFEKFSVTFNPDEIIALGDGVSYALPLRIKSEGAAVVEGKDMSILAVSLATE